MIYKAFIMSNFNHCPIVLAFLQSIQCKQDGEDPGEGPQIHL